MELPITEQDLKLITQILIKASTEASPIKYKEIREIINKLRPPAANDLLTRQQKIIDNSMKYIENMNRLSGNSIPPANTLIVGLLLEILLEIKESR